MSDALRTTTYTLTRDDALAYEQSAARLTPLALLALVLWLGAWGVGALLIPADWTGPKLGWASSILVSIALAIGYVLALTATAMRQWIRAGRRVPHRIETTLSEWPDRLEVTRAGAAAQVVPLKSIRESRLTATHLLLTTDDGVVIVPRRAFTDPEAAQDLAARIAGPTPGLLKATPPTPRAGAPVDPGRPSA